MRKLTVAITAVILLGAGAYGARSLAISRAEAALQGVGLTWEGRVDHVDSARWTGIRGRGVSAEAVELTLLPTSEVHVEGVAIDLSQVRRTGGGGTGGTAPTVVVTDLAVAYGEHIVLTGLSGTLSPRLDLTAPGGSVRNEGDGVSIALDRHLDLGIVAGDATVRVDVDGDNATLDLRMDDATVSHPMIAAKPLPSRALQVHATWSRDTGALAANLDLGTVTARVHGTATLDPLAWDLGLDVPDVPLVDVVALFGNLVPEARGAQIVGTVGLSGTITGPDLAWTLHPRAQDLGVEGALPAVDALRSGPVTWRAPAGGGQWLARTTGEGHPSWVPLTQAGLVPEAMIAAEDSAFWTHDGFDLTAISAALEGGDLESMRGGSTLTQQLVKNLFLDGERTVARKLRELILAVELERKLGKERILALYLNVVELGPEIYGIGPASEAYFLKRPDRLSAREAAFLAAILPAPRTGYERAYIGGRVPIARVTRILDNMVDGKALSPAAAGRAKRDHLRFVPPAR